MIVEARDPGICRGEFPSSSTEVAKTVHPYTALMKLTVDAEAEFKQLDAKFGYTEKVSKEFIGLVNLMIAQGKLDPEHPCWNELQSEVDQLETEQLAQIIFDEYFRAAFTLGRLQPEQAQIACYAACVLLKMALGFPPNPPNFENCTLFNAQLWMQNWSNQARYSPFSVQLQRFVEFLLHPTPSLGQKILLFWPAKVSRYLDINEPDYLTSPAFQTALSAIQMMSIDNWKNKGIVIERLLNCGLHYYKSVGDALLQCKASSSKDQMIGVFLCAPHDPARTSASIFQSYTYLRELFPNINPNDLRRYTGCHFPLLEKQVHQHNPAWAKCVSFNVFEGRSTIYTQDRLLIGKYQTEVQKQKKEGSTLLAYDVHTGQLVWNIDLKPGEIICGIAPQGIAIANNTYSELNHYCTSTGKIIQHHSSEMFDKAHRFEVQYVDGCLCLTDHSKMTLTVSTKWQDYTFPIGSKPKLLNATLYVHHPDRNVISVVRQKPGLNVLRLPSQESLINDLKLPPDFLTFCGVLKRGICIFKGFTHVYTINTTSGEIVKYPPARNILAYEDRFYTVDEEGLLRAFQLTEEGSVKEQKERGAKLYNGSRKSIELLHENNGTLYFA